MSRGDVRPPRRVVAWATAMALIAVTMAAPVTSAHGTPGTTTAIRDWNRYAVAALMNPLSPPVTVPATLPGAGHNAPVGQIHLAMVQAAVYDAVNSIVGGRQPYLAGLPAASHSASIDAAIATAAYGVLIGLDHNGTLLLPAATRAWLQVAYDASLAAVGAGAAKNNGIAAGAAAATAMLAARATDGRYGTFTFTVGTAAGQWRPTSGVIDPFAWVARVHPFTLRSPSQFRSRGPRALGSRAYARDYAEVMAIGSLTSTTRTPAQTATALFYTANPIELWNRTFRAISSARGLGVAREARLFALLNLAGADSLISCWDNKAYWSFWRPVTAIHNGDNDGNGTTVGDPLWAPLFLTPPYPDEPSGYNCVTGAVMQTAKTFFGRDRMSFDVSNAAGTITRHYSRFTAVVKDTIDARVFLGIHFRTADVSAAALGKKVSRWAVGHSLQRLHD
ncbi:MAG: hypothetical protein QOG32_1678 [Chloroflexota bacterium]|nr:hypothetical protein [Chloroflexota bacterium]